MIISNQFFYRAINPAPLNKSELMYTRRQINLYRIFFADFLVNFQAILMKFSKDYFQVRRRLP